jgi:uncharacterized protein (DUF305 family)
MRIMPQLTISFVALAIPALQHPAHTQPTARQPPPGWSELISSVDKMHASMASIAPSGRSDVDFVRLMIPHHQAAIDMAKSQLLYGKSPQLRRLAQEIITDQQSEIELMQLWLQQNQGPKEHQP